MAQDRAGSQGMCEACEAVNSCILIGEMDNSNPSEITNLKNYIPFCKIICRGQVLLVRLSRVVCSRLRYVRENQPWCESSLTEIISSGADPGLAWLMARALWGCVGAGMMYKPQNFGTSRCHFIASTSAHFPISRCPRRVVDGRNCANKRGRSRLRYAA